MRQEDLETLSRLTRDYARHGRSLPGLGLIWGGVLLLSRMGLPTLHRWILPSAPPTDPTHSPLLMEVWQALFALEATLLLVLWLAGKEFLRRRVSLTLGEADPAPRPWETYLVGMVAVAFGLAALWQPLFLIQNPELFRVFAKPFPVCLGLAGLFLWPWVTLRWVRGWQEALMWALLAAPWPAMTWGMWYGPPNLPFWLSVATPVFMALTVAAGLWQYLRLRALKRTILAHARRLQVGAL